MTDARETVAAETLDLATDLTAAYIGYARETITDRALPDVRDGLKPVQRRILYAMRELGLRQNQPHRKCARIVGETLGKFHPHGDQSIYDALVRLAQPFRMGVPLVDGQGNFGCFTGDTQVKLLDGSDRTFKELAQMYAPDQVFYVYSIDDGGNVVVGEGRHSRVTRKRAEIIELELDNGEMIRCTPDHRFMLRDGSYKQAKDLTLDDSLMAGYFTVQYVGAIPNDPQDRDCSPGQVQDLPLRHVGAIPRGCPPGQVQDLPLPRITERILAKRYLSERVDVYDITVEPYHNFLLSSGVFVHNSVDGDGAAQMRYTEARLTAAAETLLQDLDMETVGWADNFDNTLQEPTVLPGMLPNLLINGATGIAVGMATNIPPHNLGEVCDAAIYLAQNWRRRGRIKVDDLMQIIPGPDFPTGGLIYRHRDDGEGPVDVIRQAYETGRGRIVMQSRVGIEEIGGGKANIVISELPYSVLKNTVVEKLAKEVRRGRISGVTDVRDESDYEGMRLVIEVSRSAKAQDVLPLLLKYSQLRETFGAINLALIPGENGDTRPAYLSLRDMLTHFVAHRLDVIERRSRFELAKRRARLHIVEGLLKALDVLDEVIATIRRSRTVDTARNNLIKTFKFTELQAQAILDMQLRRLTALERSKLVQEGKDLRSRIKYLEGLLASEKKRLGVVITETTALKEKFATPRRTIIVESGEAGAGTVTTQSDLMLPEEPQMLVLTPKGVERHPAAGFSYRGSRTLTKGAVRDVHLAHIAVDPSDEVILLTNLGRGWKGMVGFVPEKGSPQVLGLGHKEQVIAIAVLEPDALLIVGTRAGRIKRARVEDLGLLDRQWGPVIGLAKDDELLFGDVVGPGAHILFYTVIGQLLRIDGDTINPQQTDTARGVAGISLKSGDRLLGGLVVPDAARTEKRWHVAIVSKKGYAHRVSLTEFVVKGRGTQGVRCLRPSKAAGPVADVAVGMRGLLDVYLEDGRRQRLNLKEVPGAARDALGKRLFRADKPVVRLVLLAD